MPKYFTENLFNNQLQIQLLPKGLRKYWKTYAPFFTGDLVKQELVVKSKNREIKDCTYSWAIQDYRPDTKELKPLDGGKGIFKTNPNGKASISIGVNHLLQYENEYHIILTIGYDGSEHKDTLLNFHGFSRDRVRVQFILSILGGIVGAIIGIAVGLFINKG